MSPFAEDIQELQENPTKFGAPTFEEFSRNRERYMGRYDDMLAAIDKGDTLLKCKQKYYVENYRVDSLEHAERVARDMGANIHNEDHFVIDPQVKPDSSVRGFHLEVTFRLKRELVKRSRW